MFRRDGILSRKRAIRLECVQNPVNQANLVVATLVGSPNRPQEVPWFWSDQYDAHVKMVGVFKDTEEMVLRGDPASLKYSVGFLRDGVLVALETVNSVKNFMRAKKLVASNASINVGLASDPSVALSAAKRSKENTK